MPVLLQYTTDWDEQPCWVEEIYRYINQLLLVVIGLVMHLVCRENGASLFDQTQRRESKPKTIPDAVLTICYLNFHLICVFQTNFSSLLEIVNQSELTSFLEIYNIYQL